MASFSRGTSFTDGVTGDVTAAKLHALVDSATPVAGLVTDRTAKTSVIGTDVVLISDSADSNNLKKVTVANLANNLPTAVITNGTVTTLNSTTGTIATGTFGTTTSTAATITNGTITAAVIPTLTAGTTTGTAASFSGDLTIADKIVHSGDTNTTIRFPANDTVAVETNGTEVLRVDSNGRIGIGTAPASDGGVTITNSVTRDGGWDARIALQSTAASDWPTILFSGCSATNRYGAIVQTNSTSGNTTANQTALIEFVNTSATQGGIAFSTNNQVGTTNPSEILRLSSDGNIGIGYNSPDKKLVIAANNSGVSELNTLRFLDTDTTTQGNQQMGKIEFYSSDTGSSGVKAYIGAFSEGATPNGYLAFGTDGTTGTPTEHVRLDSGGNFSIGTATALSRLHVHGNLTLSNTTTATSAGTSTITPPATVAGFLTVTINGTSRKIPYYAT